MATKNIKFDLCYIVDNLKIKFLKIYHNKYNHKSTDGTFIEVYYFNFIKNLRTHKCSISTVLLQK